MQPPLKGLCQDCCTDALDPTAGHCSPMSLPEIPGHSRASRAQSLVGSLLLFPGSWCRQGSICTLQESISKSCVSSASSVVGLVATSSKRAYAIPKSAAPRAPLLWQPTADLYLQRRSSDTVLFQSLWGPWVLVHTKFV